MRRALPSLVVALVLALALVVGCGGGGQEGGGGDEQQQTDKPVTDEFVGQVMEADTFVAIVAEKPQQGAEAREVRAYLCNGKRGNDLISEWFVGEASGDELTLTSEGGARLAAELSSEAATGEITLSDGESFRFEASPATGTEGYYPVEISEEGQVSATSWRGAKLEGRLSSGDLIGTITPPEGEPVELEAFEIETSKPNLQAGEEWRWIVFDERIKGAITL